PAESQPYEHPAEKQAQQTIAVAMRLRAVVARRLGRARFQLAGPLLKATNRLFTRLFRGRHASLSHPGDHDVAAAGLRKSRGTYRAGCCASRLGRYGISTCFHWTFSADARSDAHATLQR